MLDEVISLLVSHLLIFNVPFAAIDLLFVPIVIFLATYLLSQLEQEKKVFVIVEAEGENPLLPSSMGLEEGHSVEFSQPHETKENTKESEHKVFIVAKYFELGALAFLALGGASVVLLERDMSLSQEINQQALESYVKLNSVKKTEDLNINQELTKGKENMEIPLVISNLNIYRKSNNVLRIDSLKSVEKELSKNTKDELLLRRLMFELSPKEYASLIPTELEFEWYGLSSIW